MNHTDTPFHEGQHAFKRGDAITANPHDPNDKTDDPEDWPWDHTNWNDGWNHAQAVNKFTAQQRKQEEQP